MVDESYNHDVPVRFYRDTLPTADEVVMAIFTKVDDMVAEVILPEYANHQAIIPFSELSRRKIKRSDKTAKLGQKQPCLVTKVDRIKRYIDVSKTKIDDVGIKEFEQRFSKNSLSINLVKEFYKSFYKPAKFEREFFEELCSKTIWSFDDDAKEKGRAFEYLRRAVSDANTLNICKDLTKDEKDAFHAIIVAKLSPKAVKIRSDIEIVCRISGVNAIIKALLDAKNVDADPEGIRIAIVSPPKYFIELSGIDKIDLEKRLMRVVNAAKCNIESFKGTFSYKEPKIIGMKDGKLNEINFAINHIEEQSLSDLDEQHQTGDDDDDEDEDEEPQSGDEKEPLSDSSSSIG